MLQLSSRLVLAYVDDCILELIISNEYVANPLELCHCLLHSVWLPVHLTCPVISLLCTAHTTDIGRVMWVSRHDRPRAVGATTAAPAAIAAACCVRSRAPCVRP